MCFSFEVSISTFLFSWSVGLYILNRSDINTYKRQTTIILLIFSSMQFLDSILWANKMRKNNVNYITTSFAIPFILSLLIFYNIIIANEVRDPFILLILLFGMIYIFYRFNGYSKSVCSNKLSSPIWGSNEIKPWEFFAYSMFLSYNSIPLFLFFNFILFPFLYVYFHGAYGSLWCAISNLKALHILLTY